MSYQHYIFKMKYLCELIEKGKTGNAEELAQRLNVSRRTVFRYIEELRDRGANVNFCRYKKSFVFEEKFDFLDEFIKKVI